MWQQTNSGPQLYPNAPQFSNDGQNPLLLFSFFFFFFNKLLLLLLLFYTFKLLFIIIIIIIILCICDLLAMTIPKIQNFWKTYKVRLVLYMAKMV